MIINSTNKQSLYNSTKIIKCFIVQTNKKSLLFLRTLGIVPEEKQREITMKTKTENLNLHDYSTKEEAIQGCVDNGMKVVDAIKYVTESGLFGRKTVNQLPLMVELFRTLAGERKAIVKEVSEKTGYSPSTVNHFYNAIEFAKEWTKQSS